MELLCLVQDYEEMVLLSTLHVTNFKLDSTFYYIIFFIFRLRFIILKQHQITTQNYILSSKGFLTTELK